MVNLIKRKLLSSALSRRGGGGGVSGSAVGAPCWWGFKKYSSGEGGQRDEGWWGTGDTVGQY